MQKVYVLLRNNQQNGPFSLEELVRFDLKPIDLIWIEGKSAGWYYPQEIEALHPYLPFVKKAAPPVATPTIQDQKIFAEPAKPRHVFVAMPVTGAEEPVTKKPLVESIIDREEIFKPAPSSSAPAEKETLTAGYKRTLEEAESDYTSWIYHQKTKKKKQRVSVKGALAALLITAVSFGAWAILKLGDDKVLANTVAETPVAYDSTAEVIQTVQASNKTVTPVKKKDVANSKKIVTKKEDEKTAATTKTVKTNSVATVRKKDNDYEAGPITQEEKTLAEEKKTEPVTDTEAPVEKKKKLGEKILHLFKKKPGAAKTEETNPADENGGERRTSRREGTANLVQQVTVKSSFPTIG